MSQQRIGKIVRGAAPPLGALVGIVAANMLAGPLGLLENVMAGFTGSLLGEGVYRGISYVKSEM